MSTYLPYSLFYLTEVVPEVLKSKFLQFNRSAQALVTAGCTTTKLALESWLSYQRPVFLGFMHMKIPLRQNAQMIAMYVACAARIWRIILVCHARSLITCFQTLPDTITRNASDPDQVIILADTGQISTFFSSFCILWIRQSSPYPGWFWQLQPRKTPFKATARPTPDRLT